MKSSSSEGIAQTLVAWEKQFLRSLALLITTYARTTLVLCLGLAALASVYTIQHLGFISGRNDLISPDKQYVQLDEQYAKEFVGIDQLVVVVSPRDVQQGKDFVTRLAEVLERDTTHVEEVFYRIDTSSLEGKKLLYLPPEDLRSLHRDLEEYQDLVRDLTTAPGLNTLFRSLNEQVSIGMVSHLVSGLLGLEPSAEPTGEKKPVKMAFFQSLLQELERALSMADYRYHSPWGDFFGGAEELSDGGFLMSDNRHFLFLMVEPKKSDGNVDVYQQAIATIRQSFAKLLPDFPGLEAGVTGTKALSNDETLSTQADAGVATVVSLTGVTLLYLFFFRKIRHPLLIVTTLTVGLAWTMGFVALTVGHLTIITVFVAPMLLGIADDFGVHLISRYEEERSLGQSAAAALRTVFEHTVPGIAAGAFTTALAFYAVMLADFRGMQELGWITGSGILLSLLATLTLLPAFVVVIETYRPWRAETKQRPFLTSAFAALGAFTERARRPLLLCAGLLTVGALAALPTVSFDYNLLHLQAHGTESVEWEMRIIKNSERSSWNVLATASSLEEAVRKAAAFASLPTVEAVESVASLIPNGQEERLQLIQTLQPLLRDLPPTLAPTTPVDVSDLRRTLDKLRLKVREENDGRDPVKKPTEPELSEVRRSLLAVIKRLQTLPEDEARAKLERFQDALFVDFRDKWSLLRNNLDPSGPVTLADIPPQLKRRFVSENGQKFLLQVYAKKNLWDREPLEEFISQIRQVDPDVTGSPVIGYESIRAMQAGYIEGGMYAFIVIVVVTFCALRRFGDTLLAMVPLSLGMIWTAGLMWLFGLQFNLANLVAVPLIIGIGVENGIHLLHRFREDGQSSPATLVSGSTGQAVALFSLTTMVGFGSLLVANYYGIFSMGLLLTLAVGSVLVASLTVLPLLLSRSASEEATTRLTEEEAPVRERVQRRA